MKHLLTLTALLFGNLVWLLPETGLAGEISPTLEAKIERLQADAEIDILIFLSDQTDLNQFKSLKGKDKRININTTLRKKAEKSQKKIRQFLRNSNGRNIKPFWIVNGIAARVPAGVVADIAQQPD